MEINRLTGDGACSQCTENPTKDAGDAKFPVIVNTLY